MNEQENMRCPFRRTKEGDFMACYGKDCMAYCEYDSPIVCYTEDGKPAETGKVIHVNTCKLTTQFGMTASF